MAVHLSIGRIPFGFLVLSLAVFFGVAGSRAAELPGQAARQAAERAVALNAANPGIQAASRAGMLFESGAEIRIQKDAKVFITSRNIPENDRLLEAYNADQTEAGRFQNEASEAVVAPGLLGIALQARRAQEGAGQGDQAYSLADAMRDAIWRKKTAAKLRSLATGAKLRSPTTAVGGCAEGADDTAKSALSTGLGASC